MSKAYLFVYDQTTGDREKVKAVLNGISMVNKWRYDMPNTFYIISDYTAEQLARAIRKSIGDKGRFIVSEIPSNSFGWLTGESWYLIQNKKYKPKNS